MPKLQVWTIDVLIVTKLPMSSQPLVIKIHQCSDTGKFVSMLLLDMYLFNPLTATSAPKQLEQIQQMNYMGGNTVYFSR